MHERNRRHVGLSQPWTRTELIAFLEELASDDPRPGWIDEVRRGLVSGVDEVVHFFFDDHDFGERALGEVLIDADEVAAIKAVQAALSHLVDLLPDGSDDDYVRHRDWPAVTLAARAALARIQA